MRHGAAQRPARLRGALRATATACAPLSLVARRTLYEAVGLGWVYAVTSNPVVGRLADAAYELW